MTALITGLFFANQSLRVEQALMISVSIPQARRAVTPEKATFTIKNVKPPDVKKIELLSSLQAYIFYNENETYGRKPYALADRPWISCTTFGKQYAKIPDSKIIPKLSEIEIDQISDCQRISLLSEKNKDLRPGYWEDPVRSSIVDYRVSDLQKYAIVTEASEVSFKNNQASITIQPQKVDFNQLHLRIEKANGEIVYSEGVIPIEIEYGEIGTENFDHSPEKIAEINYEVNFEQIKSTNRFNLDKTVNKQSPLTALLVRVGVGLGLALIAGAVAVVISKKKKTLRPKIGRSDSTRRKKKR